MSTTGLSTENGLTERKRNLVEPGGGGDGVRVCGGGGGGGGEGGGGGADDGIRRPCSSITNDACT